MEIARKHLWPKLLKRSKLTSKIITITDPTIRQIIDGYAREAGVRSLEKLLNKIIRKSIVAILKEGKQKINVNIKTLEDYLGPPVFKQEKQITGVGVVTGLAWTPLGGVTLAVEVARVHENNSGIKLTGQLGDVMRESAEIAVSYIQSHIKIFKGDPEFFKSSFIHIHVPEGATPKDGPSAGVTLATALLSLVLNKKVDPHIAMTGEITLTGEVLAVGGIREKIIAARRTGIKKIILPEAVTADFIKLPDHIKEGIEFHFAKKYKDVFDIVFK